MITLPAQITWTFLSPHVTAYGAQMTFHIKTRVGQDLIFMLLPLEVYAKKNLFSTISYLFQNVIWHIVALTALARFRIVTHSYAA